MKVKLRSFPEKLPVSAAEFLTMLDTIVVSDRLRPGDDPQLALYQSGARDLVDMLVGRFEMERVPQEESPKEWYGDDEDLKNYIEGGW